MVIAVFLLLGTSLVIVQTSMLPLLPEWLGRPDPLFILLVYAALRLEIYQGAILTLIFGMLLDIFSGPFLGLHPVIFLVLFVILRTLTANLVLHDNVHQVPLTAASYLLASGGLYLFASLLMPESSMVWAWRPLVLQLLLITVFTIPLFELYEGLRLRAVRRQKKYSSLSIQPGNRVKP